MVGYGMFLLFIKEEGYIESDKVASMMTQARTVFLDMCDRQSKRVESENPTNLFIELLREMLETKTVRVDGVNGDHKIGSTSELIGYKDDSYYYLIPQSSYTQVYEFYRSSGYTFPASKKTLWQMMMDEGRLVPEIGKDGKVRPDKRKAIRKRIGRYITIPTHMTNPLKGLNSSTILNVSALQPRRKRPLKSKCRRCGKT